MDQILPHFFISENFISDDETSIRFSDLSSSDKYYLSHLLNEIFYGISESYAVFVNCFINFFDDYDFSRNYEIMNLLNNSQLQFIKFF